MTPDQFQLFLKDNRESTARAIKETVNGKIDELRREVNDHNKKHEADMKEMKPFMQGAAGLQLIFKFFLMVGSLSVGWVAIKDVFNIK